MWRYSGQEVSGKILEEGRELARILEKFGGHLRKVRLRKKISQEKLAELAGLHRTYVSSVERGERNISLINIHRLAKALDVKLRELMPPGD